MSCSVPRKRQRQSPPPPASRSSSLRLGLAFVPEAGVLAGGLSRWELGKQAWLGGQPLVVPVVLFGRYVSLVFKAREIPSLLLTSSGQHSLLHETDSEGCGRGWGGAGGQLERTGGVREEGPRGGGAAAAALTPH